MTRQQFIKGLIALLSAETGGCRIQHGNCPCNTCFHALPDEVDYRHILWLVVLGLRGDYLDMRDELLSDIKKEFDAVA